jgi:CRP-like cAMP-binding protein
MDSERLADVPLFAGLSADERNRLAAVCQEAEVVAGTTLVQEGDFGYSMFAILSGAADVTRDGALVHTLGPGEVFGEIAVMSSGRRTATVTAKSDMRLIVLLNRDLWRLDRDSPGISEALRQTIVDRRLALERASSPAH